MGRNYYFNNWPRPQLVNPTVTWIQVTKSTNQCTGYFKDAAGTPLQTGVFSSNNLAYLTAGALVKFVPPKTTLGATQYFLPNGNYTTIETTATSPFKWVKVSVVIGDGSYSGLGTLPNGTGPIILTQNVKSDAIAQEVIPTFDSSLSFALQTDITQFCLSKRNFGLSFSATSRSWYIINDTDLNLTDNFNLVFQQDVTNSNRDSSWIFAFTWTGLGYEVQYRTTEYIFESENETAFYFDNNSKNYDFATDTVIKDQITVLGIN